jgi:hypothetical protein
LQRLRPTSAFVPDMSDQARTPQSGRYAAFRLGPGDDLPSPENPRCPMGLMSMSLGQGKPFFLQSGLQLLERIVRDRYPL